MALSIVMKFLNLDLCPLIKLSPKFKCFQVSKIIKKLILEHSHWQLSDRSIVMKLSNLEIYILSKLSLKFTFKWYKESDIYIYIYIVIY